MTEQDLLSLVRSRELDALDRAWAAATANPGAVGDYRQVLAELCDADAVGVALAMCKSMVSALGEKSRADEALQLSQELIKRQAHDPDLFGKLDTLITSQFSNEPWFDIARRLSGMNSDDPPRDALAKFEKVRRFTPNHALYHRGGWGVGVIEELDAKGETVQVRFESGSTKEFPIESAVETLRPLDDDDLRAMKLLDLEGLQALAESEPAVLIRKAAQVYRGSITSTQVKSELSPSVIPTKKWASWWKKAKTAAANDPWLQIEGSKTRPVFELRRRPLTLAEEAGRVFDQASDLEEVIETARGYIARGLDESAQSTILDLSQQKVESALQKHSDTPAHLLDGILFLEQFGRSTSVSAAEELREVLMEEGEFRAQNLNRLNTQQSQEHAVGLLPEALGEAWVSHTVANITNFPPTLIEPVVDLLTEAKQEGELVSAWAKAAPYPKRYPILTYLLGRLYTDGSFEGRENAPDLISVGRVMLHLCRIISAEYKGDTVMTRIKTRLVSLLVGRRALLTRCYETIGRDDMATYLGITERGGPDFPGEISDSLIRVVAKKYPEITQKPEKPFWENEDRIYVTADGVARKKEEHRVLVDEKIPLNAKAINAAAAYGDLSENAEWEAAMEEQRNLTGRAEEISNELKMARLLEDQEIPDGVCAPGTRITYRFTDDNSTQAYRILGPWDAVEGDTDVLNYKAPLAEVFLGRSEGDEGVIENRDSSRAFVVESIERLI